MIKKYEIFNRNDNGFEIYDTYEDALFAYNGSIDLFLSNLTQELKQLHPLITGVEIDENGNKILQYPLDIDGNKISIKG